MSVQAAVAWLNKRDTSGNSAAITTITARNNQPLVPTWKKHSTPEGPKIKGTDATLKRIRAPLSNRGATPLLGKFDSSGGSGTQIVATARSRSNSVLTNKSKQVAVTTANRIDAVIHDLIDMYHDALQQSQTAQDTIQQMQEKEQQQRMIVTKTSDSDCALIRDYEIRIQYLSEKVEQLSAEHNDLENELSLYRDPDAGVHIVTSTRTYGIHTPISPDSAKQHSNDDKQWRITIETKSTQESDQPDDFWNCLLDTYEKESSVGTTITMGEEMNGVDDVDNVHVDGKAVSKEAMLESLLFAQKQVIETEKGAQLMFEQQAHELHAERSQSRYLAHVVEKQGYLIDLLEEKLSAAEHNNGQLLLQEQVELQQVELEDKRALLGRLLDEREEILQQHQQQHQQQHRTPNRSRSASVRSSIDVLSEMSKTEYNNKHPLSRTSSSSLHHSIYNNALGRSTPPPTAPPRDRLPSLPYKATLSTSRSLYLATGPTSSLSPTTSWSSAEYAVVTRTGDLGSIAGHRDSSLQPQLQLQQQNQQRSLSVFDSPANMVVPPTCTPPSPLNRQSTSKLLSKKSSRGSSMSPNGTFWKGWKHRLGSRT